MSKEYPFKLTKRAGKVLQKVRKTDRHLYEKINHAIKSICVNPSIGQAKQGDLKGFYSLDVYHQSSNYEIFYAIKEDKNGDLIAIILIGSRENFYAELKRYLNL